MTSCVTVTLRVVSTLCEWYRFVCVSPPFRVNSAARVYVRAWWWALSSLYASLLGSFVRPPETKEVQLPQPFCCCCLVFAWSTKPQPSPTYLLSQMNSSLYRYHKTRRTSSHYVFDLFYQPVTLPKVMTRMCFLLSVSAPQSRNTCYNFMCRSQGGSTETTQPLCQGRLFINNL